MLVLRQWREERDVEEALGKMQWEPVLENFVCNNGQNCSVQWKEGARPRF